MQRDASHNRALLAIGLAAIMLGASACAAPDAAAPAAAEKQTPASSVQGPDASGHTGEREASVHPPAVPPGGGKGEEEIILGQAGERYQIERIRAAAEFGRPVQELDLNGDGKVEGIIGVLGQWHGEEVLIVDHDGNHRMTLNGSLPPSVLGRVDLVPGPGLPNPVLVVQTGSPDQWHRMWFTWMEGEQFVSPWGWHPKTNLAFGQGYAIQPDGTVEITGSLAGHSFVRQYRIERAEGDSFTPYQAVLQDEQVTPGPYPTTAADLLTALFIARWYDLHDQIERYVPDPAVRAAFMAQDVGRVLYAPVPVQVGRLVEGDYGPRIEPGEPDSQGYVEFLASVQQYEGGSYWTGRAVIGTAEDGRRVVTGLEFLDQGWSL